MRFAFVALIIMAASCVSPTVEEALEKRISEADSCLELEIILSDVMSSRDTGDLSGSVALELVEFVSFRAFVLLDEMQALGFVSPALERCEILADSLFQALFVP